MIPREEIDIVADLKTDEYVFTSVCPDCEEVIVNRRKM
jgi:hypothetical protein